VGLLLSIPLTSFCWPQTIEALSPVSGPEVSSQSITPTDAFARIQLLSKELDDLRFDMGKPNICQITP
jgi:hypothetical protein